MFRDAFIFLFVASILTIASPAASGQVCSCNGDVDGNGVTQIQDLLCILDCKLGDCACCVNSCDINCDGVVDDADATDDPVNGDGAWYCVFSGNPASVCCPSSGACCDLLAGLCENDVIEVDCVGNDMEWSDGLTCLQVSCLPLPSTSPLKSALTTKKLLAL